MSTGRHVHHDEASRRYEAPRRAPRPVSWLHRLEGPVLNQGYLNACTGFAGANFLNSALAYRVRQRFNIWANRPLHHYVGNPEGEKLYSLATLNDPFGWQYPPTDEGSSGLGVAKALKGMGVIDRYEWTFDFSNALAWAQRQPVLIGVLWSEPMFDPDADGIIHIGTDKQLRSAVDSGMGHEVLWRGCRWDRKLARIRNQWTEQWGIDGEALIPLDELERLIMSYRGDVMVPGLVSAP